LEYEGVTSDNKERHSRSVATPMDLTTRAWCLGQLYRLIHSQLA
jgi:hypothetical protein